MAARVGAVEQMSDLAMLERVAAAASHPAVTAAAVEKIVNAQVLERLARQGKDISTKSYAVLKITNRKLLRELAGAMPQPAGGLARMMADTPPKGPQSLTMRFYTMMGWDPAPGKSVRRWVGDLASGDPAAAGPAGAVVTKLGLLALPDLLRVLSEGDSGRQAAAEAQVARLGAAALPELLRVLTDGADPAGAAAAARCVRKLGPAAVSPLRETLAKDAGTFGAVRPLLEELSGKRLVGLDGAGPEPYLGTLLDAVRKELGDTFLVMDCSGTACQSYERRVRGQVNVDMTQQCFQQYYFAGPCDNRGRSVRGTLTFLRGRGALGTVPVAARTPSRVEYRYQFVDTGPKASDVEASTVTAFEAAIALRKLAQAPPALALREGTP
jgi:hypothetical protein